MEYYSAILTNGQWSYVQTWWNLECILVKWKSQSEKTAYCIIPIIWHSRKSKTKKIVKQWVAGRGSEKGVENGIDEAQEIFKVMAELFYMIVFWWIFSFPMEKSVVGIYPHTKKWMWEHALNHSLKWIKYGSQTYKENIKLYNCYKLNRRKHRWPWVWWWLFR